MRYGVLVAAAAFLIALSSPAFAGVGLSPASIYFPDMMRGGYSEAYLTVSNPMDEDVTVKVSVEGPISGWVMAEPAVFNISGVGYKLVKIVTRPPLTIANGMYSGRLLVIAEPMIPPELAGGSSISVASAVSADTSVLVSDIQLQRYAVEGMAALNTEECRPVIVLAETRNTGNVNVTPRFVIDMYSAGGDFIQNFGYTANSMYPTTTQHISMRLPYKMTQFGCIPKGSYIVNTKAYAGDSIMDKSSLSFNVFKRGTMSVAGEITGLKVPKTITAGEVAKIDAVFKNTGEVPVSTKLKAEIYQGGRLVGTAESESKDLGLGGIDTLTAYYTPTMGGKYKVVATALFEEKSSNTMEAEMDVQWPLILIVGMALAGVTVVGIMIFVMMKRGLLKMGGMKIGTMHRKKGRR